MELNFDSQASFKARRGRRRRGSTLPAPSQKTLFESYIKKGNNPHDFCQCRSEAKCFGEWLKYDQEFHDYDVVEKFNLDF